MKNYVSKEQVYEYCAKFLKAGQQPNTQFAARRFGVTADTIRVKMRDLIADGRLIRRGQRLYLKGQDILLDQRKNTASDETNRKKAEAGKAVAFWRCAMNGKTVGSGKQPNPDLLGHALAVVLLWADENGVEPVREDEVVEIVKMYEGGVVAEEFVPTASPVFVERRKAQVVQGS